VVQVYLDPGDDPIRLAGWTAADAVAPCEHRTVHVALDPRVLRRWTPEGWQPLHGGRLVVARGLGDVRLELDRPTSGARGDPLSPGRSG
jgi:beta-glucosidase